MCAALSIVPPDRKPKTSVMTTIGDQLAGHRPALAIDRMVDPAGREQDAEQTQDRPRRTDGRGVATEHEAGGRTGRGAGQVEGQEPERSVPALDDRARDVQRVHVEGEMEQVDVEERHRPEPPVLPLRHAELVELERLEDVLALVGEQRGERDDRRHRDDQQGERQPRRVAASAREVAPRGAGVAGLLGQPAEAVGDLGLVLGRRPPVGLPIGLDGARVVAGSDARGRDVAPGRVGRRRLGQVAGWPTRSGRPRPRRRAGSAPRRDRAAPPP